MFMFRKRRPALVKSLLKHRKRPTDETHRQPLLALLMKGLTEPDLEYLLEAVETRGAVSRRCILTCCGGTGGGSGTDGEVGPTTAAPDDARLLSVRAWRWPDLGEGDTLKKLPTCRSRRGSTCCNPYHWSRLSSLPEPAPPPYSRYAPSSPTPSETTITVAKSQGDEEPTSGQLELRGSQSTAGEGEAGWCRLAYWELSRRVGRQYPVYTESINVFWSLPHADGLSLEALASAGSPPPSSSPPAVIKTRQKIGKGVTLSREEDGVWAFNLSESPMFINSPALDDPESRFLLVYRLPPGYCLNIYSPASHHQRGAQHRGQVGPVDPNSVRISFAKGWGPKYSRQEITACPVWIEILMAPSR